MKQREVFDPIAETWDSLSKAQRRALLAWSGGVGEQKKTVLVLWNYGLVGDRGVLTEHGVKVREYGAGVTA